MIGKLGLFSQQKVKKSDFNNFYNATKANACVANNKPNSIWTATKTA